MCEYIQCEWLVKAVLYLCAMVISSNCMTVCLSKTVFLCVVYLVVESCGVKPRTSYLKITS